MPAFINKKSLLYIAGVVLLAIVGNAVWEFIARPTLLAGQDLLLNLSTLGVQRFKDSMYVQIAKGHYDRASLLLLGQFTAVYVACLLAGPYWMFRLTRRLRESHAKLKEEVRASLGQEYSGIENFNTQEFLAELESNDPMRRLNRLLYLGYFLFLALAVGNLTEASRTRYVESAVSNFEQTLSIAKPYLTEPKKEELMRSAFSQIRNKDGYVALLLELRGIAEKNGQHVPDFRIW